MLETVQVDESRPSDDALAALTSIDTVSPASRAVLILHFQEELTLAEVAAVLEIPIGTVRSRLAYGLTVLRKRLSDTAAAGNRRFEVSELSGLNHLLQTSGTGAPTEYGEIEETMAPVAMETITRWIKEQ